jgi:hypothetical protein
MSKSGTPEQASTEHFISELFLGTTKVNNSPRKKKKLYKTSAIKKRYYS